MGILEPEKYGDLLHEFFLDNYENRKSVNNEDNSIPKNRKKPNKDDKKKDNQVEEPNHISKKQLIPQKIELEPNSSKFAIFSAIRAVVIEAEAKQTILFNNKKKSFTSTTCCHHCVSSCNSGTNFDCRCHFVKGNLDNDTDGCETDTEDNTTEREVIQKVPQIVGAGLKSLFELIAEARNVHPNLCTKALRAIFDVIQGQTPESFKTEPIDLIDPLYDLLLDLATLHVPATTDRNVENWSATGCSALLGLCVARGDTGKILKAIAALLMTPKILSIQNIQLPYVLSTLQRSVFSVALGKPSKPDFFKTGIPKNSLIDQFSIKKQLPPNNQFNLQPSIASDGKFIYILIGKALLKVGSGFNGTLKGYLYGANYDFGKEKNGWIGFCNNSLYYKRFSKRSSNESILCVNTETMTLITGSQHIPIPSSRDGLNYLLFTDGETLNAICTTKDDSLTVKQLSSTTVFDLPLKLARKNFTTYGYASFEEEILNQIQIQKIQSTCNPFEPKLPNDLEVMNIVCGKEFGLVRGSNGKVFYYGKATSIGLKSIGKSPTLKMTELIISKIANISQISIGHDGLHALLINDDGTVYFVGSSRRGEDGDSSKNRRQPKAVKPKKITKIDGHFIVNVSCNNGTSAFVTRNGKLIMFGKDTTHCDASGLVTDLSDEHITKVSLGKANCVALNSKGHLYTFGLNNKGQCARQFTKEKENYLSMETSTDVKSMDKFKTDLFNNMCDPDEHSIVQGQCKVCSICKECSGYNISCVSTMNIEFSARVPGSNCACGHGDAGCSKCGACSACISFQENENVNDPTAEGNITILSRHRSKSLVLRKNNKKSIEETNLSSDIERDSSRVVAPLPPQKVILPSSSAVIQISCGLHHTVILTLAGEVFTFGSNQYGQLGTGDLQAVSGPIQIKVPGLVSQVVAGSNHTVLLTYKGGVYTFGSYQKGQLGRAPNDFQINSNSNEESANKHDEHVLTQRQKFLWNCTPGIVSGVGPNFGKRASWIGASGDQTFIKIDESLVTGTMLTKVNVVADKNTILLIPNIPLSFNCLSINRRDGTCNAHTNNQVDFSKIIQSNNSQINQLASDKCNQNITLQHHELARMSQSMHEARNQMFELQENSQNFRLRNQQQRQQQEKYLDKVSPQLAFTIDSFQGVFWVFDAVAKNISCYNVLASEMSNKTEYGNDLRAILSPQIALPLKSDSQITRSQASLNLLACLDILTSANNVIPYCFETTTSKSDNSFKEVQSNDYQTVSRFENFGGGWGYSGHSVEAIRFMSDTDILVGGFGMFGGRGEYTCKIKLYDVSAEDGGGGGYEKEGILISETEEVPFECAARSKYNIMLTKPVTINSGKWYLVWARISGPSSDCGSAGQSNVTTEDQVVFSFKSSKKANNGTDVNSGQIPSILYRVITQETKQPNIPIDLDPVHRISSLFAKTVTKECFESLVILLNWSWSTFKLTLTELKDIKKYLQTKTNLERLVYINKSSLRLLRKYTNEIYPNTFFIKNEKTSKKNSSTNQEKNSKSYGKIFPLQNQGPSTSKQQIPPTTSKLFTGSMDATTTTPTNPKKINSENLQLAECIGDVRALLMTVLCDEIPQDLDNEGHKLLFDVLDECHKTFVSCFNAFYPTSTLKWNCLCDLLTQMDKGILHSRLLSAILAGLCSPTVKLQSTFSLLTPIRESKSIVSPSDNSGLPMLTSTENHLYPVLVEQMIYRTQKEKQNFHPNSWTFKDVLVRLLDIVSQPIRTKIANIYSNRNSSYCLWDNTKSINQGLIDNCCHLLARVLAEIVYQCCAPEFDTALIPSRSLHATGSRFGRCDVSKTWNTGNFGPDAIAFSVDRPRIAIAGAMVYSGSGSYEYQLELLYDTMESKSQHRWETLESVSGTYDQDAVQNEMTEIKFDRRIHIKENCRYAIRLCSQGARTCSGDSGISTIRGPCGTNFSFFPCDLSFNGTTPARGQIPQLLYYSTPKKSDNQNGKILDEIHAKDTALLIASDITKRCSELLIFARNAVIVSNSSSSDKSPNSSNNTQTIDSEHNITPIEEHLDITWNNSISENNLSTARDLTKKFETFSKGIMDTLKFDKRSTNPIDFEIEIGATEITPKDLLEENEIIDKNIKNAKMSKINGNNRNDERNNLNDLGKSDSEESVTTQISRERIVEIFGVKDASMFHTLLPLVFAHIGQLVTTDPKSSVYILTLIKEILPHVAVLNKLYQNKDVDDDNLENNQNLLNLCTTSNHYCTVESEHPYKSASISTYLVEFPSCVQWLTIEFDSQCGTGQPEDYLIFSIPTAGKTTTETMSTSVTLSNDNENVQVSSSFTETKTDRSRNDWIVVKKYNTSSQWSQNAVVFPGNKIELSLETASDYLRDQQANRFGFKCLIVGYDNPALLQSPTFSLIRLENELAYLGGMCSANLMKKNLILSMDKSEHLNSVEETLTTHSSLLSKGLALPENLLTINQVLESNFPMGQSNERQFLKDFVSGAPGSSGARLAAWLQPEPRLDPNRCELKAILEPVRYGWPTQLTVIARDQYGDNVFVPDLKIEITAIPSGSVMIENRKIRRISQTEPPNSLGGVPLPPKVSYEPVIEDKTVLKSITLMKAYQQYSFEELRFASPIQTRTSEILFAQDLGNGSFSATWTPNSVGNYSLKVSIDGISLEEIYRVEVKETGSKPPPSNKSNIKKTQPPNKLRKFIAKNSAGLRIRSHPTLQSEQVGIINMNGIISLIDEIENDDGIWVRLSTESIRQHCTAGWYPVEAWCLQYNQHIGKTLLHPVIENQSTKTIIEKHKKKRQTVAENNYEEVMVDQTTTIPLIQNNDFKNTKLSENNPFVFTSSTPLKSDDEINTKDENFENEEDEIDNDVDDDDDDDQNEELFPQEFDKKKSNEEIKLSQTAGGSSVSSNQTNIGSALAGVVGGGASKLQALHKWFKGDGFEGRDSSKKKSDLSELASVSVRDIVKAIGGQDNTRSNGNATMSPLLSRSSSPVSVPSGKYRDLHSNQSSCSKSIEIDVSDTSVVLNSLNHENSIKEEEQQQTPSESSLIDDQNSINSLRNNQSSMTNSRKLRNKRDMTEINQILDENSEEVEKTIWPSVKNPQLFDSQTDSSETLKRALPPSLAESLRAVFAAFLWHENIYHDAMACASFLKFHPSLPKEGIASDGQKPDDALITLTREQKAQQRHSVEVANAGNYLNIRPSTLETLTKSGNFSVHNRRYRKNNDDYNKLHPLSETTVLPPALRSLVYLWEQVCTNCVQLVQSNAFEQQTKIKNPPARPPRISSKDIEYPEKEPNKKINRKKNKDDGSWCELCELYLPIPVTYHMRIVHIGCGKPAKGKGYNSVGSFCEGWAGNCGEGGKGASSWYLMCDSCREKFLTNRQPVNNLNSGPASGNLNFPSLSNEEELTTTQKSDNLFGLKTSFIMNSEIYTMMKENALFLLELSSTSSGNLCSNQKKSPQQMSMVSESQDLNRPGTSQEKRGGKIPIVNISTPDLIWPAPEIFSCLETLGSSFTSTEHPYEILGVKDRPLSEMSFDSIDPNGFDMFSSGTNQNSSRFHRSMSMGQGWSTQRGIIPGKNVNMQEQSSRVVMRRRNNSNFNGITDQGSVLLCYPSPNLRKLVPENINPLEQESLLLEHSDTFSDFSKRFQKTNETNQQQTEKEINETTVSLIFSRPVMNFILQQHDLKKLKQTMEKSLRIATCRIYSMQSLNWLMRSVTQTIGLHDLMWWFVTSLTPTISSLDEKSDEIEQTLEHPVNSTQMSGKVAIVLNQTLHTFLQTVADLTLLLPAGSALQRIAVQCFGIKFQPSDHQFLHRSHVFSNISKILSQSDQQNNEDLLTTSSMQESNLHLATQTAKVTNLIDLNGMFEITVSSRQALASSLTDNSTETFWESDEEDRNKSKIIEISLTKLNYVCKAIYVHIDNSRDIGNRVSNIIFYGGQSLGDTNLLKSVEVDNTKSGIWISSNINNSSCTHFRLELRGPESTLRVRQIKLLGQQLQYGDGGEQQPSNSSAVKLIQKITNSNQIQQRNCETETLRVFRLITGQVFGKLILGSDLDKVEGQSSSGGMEASASSMLADSLDMREHMVGILFSRSKLSHLQKQVIVHIVYAIKKEAQRAKEEWEIVLNNTLGGGDQKSDSSSEHSRAPDTYCFEMLSMVLALSGSGVGRSYLSHQHGLLKDLLSLLHTGSDRVQRQVTALLRRMLPEISPEIFGDILEVQKMPPVDFNIANQQIEDFDMRRLGILDIFLSLIAKSLQLQVKIKTSAGNGGGKHPYNIKLSNCIDLTVHNFENESEANQELDGKNLNQRWFLKGSISVKQAENIILLIRDMATGKLSEKWSLVTKAAIAESILNLTRVEEVFRNPESCIKTATLWLALASLCVLDKEHVERLSSGQWSKPSEARPLCTNHDDGVTAAVIQCDACGSLCNDCDRFLHLNRKTRIHHRTVCKEEEDSIRVELHESCGRTKLFWLLALADSKTLKAIVEFRDGNNTITTGASNSVGRCRFCGITGNSGLLAIGNVCSDPQCQEHHANSCGKLRPCGHSCGGVLNELKCLPCLQHTCHERENEIAENMKEPRLTQDSDDMCMICFTEALLCAPSIQLDCGHVFHYNCGKTVLQKRWAGPKISFSFSQCPICKTDISHPSLVDILEPIIALKNDVKRKALMRMEYEGIVKTSDYKDLTSYAMDRYAYYVCFKCQKAYFGGEARCDAEMGDNFDPEELVCGGCSDIARAQMCPKHGTDFLEYKCRYCCSVAVFFCFGTTHFCDTCHDDFQRLTNIPKIKLPRCPCGPKATQLLGDDCPLHIVHPATGDEFPLGCGICRNALTF